MFAPFFLLGCLFDGEELIVDVDEYCLGLGEEGVEGLALFG